MRHMSDLEAVYLHYDDVMMSVMASQIIRVSITGLCRGKLNSPHKRQVTRKMFPVDDVIMISLNTTVPIPPASQHMVSISFNSSSMVILETSGIYWIHRVWFMTHRSYIWYVFYGGRNRSFSDSNCCFNWTYVYNCGCVHLCYWHISHYLALVLQMYYHF